MELYDKISEMLDKYSKTNKIPTNRLSIYLESGSKSMEKFIKRNKLSDIDDIESIIVEQIELKDRSVMTLENFTEYIKEDFKFNKLSICLYKGVEPPSIDYEKFLANHYDTNLSNITIVDATRHLFEISDWSNKKFKSVIYHKDDFDTIHKNITEFIYEKLSGKTVKVIDDIEVPLESILDKEAFGKYMSKSLNGEDIVDIISDCINLEFQSSSKDYYIWGKLEN